MAGERGKLTVAEKGKEKVVEGRIEAPLTRRPLVIHEPSATAESRGLRRSTRNRNPPSSRMDPGVTPPSRKRTRDEDDDLPDIGLLTALPSPPVADENHYRELFLKASSAVVTIAFDNFIGTSNVTKFQTGLILMAEEKHAWVVTAMPGVGVDVQKKLSVYFNEVKCETNVYELPALKEENLLLLVVETQDSQFEFQCFRAMEGRLGFFKGTVGAPSCYALDASGKYITGSGKYFQLGLCFHDDIITLSNVDSTRHKSKVAEVAPIFRLDGNCAGIISSDSDWVDSKIGLLAESVISCLKTYYGVDWKEMLKQMAKDVIESS